MSGLSETPENLATLETLERGDRPEPLSPEAAAVMANSGAMPLEPEPAEPEPSKLETGLENTFAATQVAAPPPPPPPGLGSSDPNPEDEMPGEVEMSIFDHLEELRQRIFYSLIGAGIAIAACFTVVRPIVKLLEAPAQGVKFLQLAPGEYFFVSIKVAAYSGLLLASPWILYQIIAFVLPGLTRKERRLLGPVVLGSSVLFVGGLAFSYLALVPAALNFFISYGAEVVEQSWSIDKYFEFVLLLMFSTGLAFQIPIVQALLGVLGLVSSGQMLAGWRYVLIGAAVLGAVLTPSTDPLTQSLLGGAVLALYFGGVGLVKLFGK
jgi:sec-independent protein translocase protein TatC